MRSVGVVVGVKHENKQLYGSTYHEDARPNVRSTAELRVLSSGFLELPFG